MIHRSSTPIGVTTIPLKHRMGSGASYRPKYASNGQQPTNSVAAHLRRTHHQHVGPGSSQLATGQQVDSWRSYRDDQSNLQSTMRAQAQQHRPDFFDPNFPSSHPDTNVEQPLAHSRPPSYPQLRSPDGPQWRQKPPQDTTQSYASTPGQPQPATRYPLRGRMITTNQDVSSADRPIPSIEDPNTTSSILWTVPSTGTGASLRAHGRFTPSDTRSPTPVPVPLPTQAYQATARLAPYRIENPQRLLVILDLNGTLLHRTNRSKNPSSFQLRPGVSRFLEYLFTNHDVMVYSSARPENVTAMVNKLMRVDQRNALVAIWGRDKLDLTKAQYNSKVQVYKKLEKIWNDAKVRKRHGESKPWDQSNTVLVDDSLLKASAQPHNLLLVSEFTNDKPKSDEAAMNVWLQNQQAVLKELERKLEELKWQGDVSRLIREWQAESKTPPISPRQRPALGDEATKQGVAALEQTLEADLSELQLLTPRSPVATQSPDNNVIREGEDHGGRDKSVSPIDENIWKEILDGSASGTSAIHDASNARHD